MFPAIDGLVEMTTTGPTPPVLKLSRCVCVWSCTTVPGGGLSCAVVCVSGSSRRRYELVGLTMSLVSHANLSGRCEKVGRRNARREWNGGVRRRGLSGRRDTRATRAGQLARQPTSE